MKKRPVLTVVATDDEVDSGGLLRPPQPTVKAIASLHLDSKAGEDSDDDELDDKDALEISCDIGETSLKKGPIHINRTGVTFLSDEDSAADSDSDAKPHARPSSSSSSKGSSAPSPPRRTATQKQITLEELEASGLIGRGCSGHVVKATHRASGQLYAIKVVNNVYDKAKRDQMLTEIRTLYSVESAYLVQCYGAYFKDHQLSLVLEYCAAGSLDGLITTRAPVPEPIIVCMAFAMLSGLRDLKHAHHFHRDVKPQNILVQRDGTVKLTDFGLARELGHSQDMAQTFVGTFKYMSPERVMNEPYNYKSDIWSMGLVLLELATGVFPFRHARSYIDVVQSIIECTEPELPPDTSDLAFTDAFRAFISDCVRKDPKKRGSVDKLLGSGWLAYHGATDGPRCAARVKQWLDGHDGERLARDLHHEAKDQSADSDDEIEEDIQHED